MCRSNCKAVLGYVRELRYLLSEEITLGSMRKISLLQTSLSMDYESLKFSFGKVKESD